MRGTPEFDELQEFFERTVKNTDGVYVECEPKTNRADRLPDGSYPSTHFYENGKLDGLFRVFLSGYQFANVKMRE